VSNDGYKRDFAALAARLGEGKLRDRMLQQANHWARLSHQGKGIFRIEPVVSIDTLARWGLRGSGLWKRAHRNIFDIRLVETSWHLPHLPRAFDGFRLLQISDLHVDIDPGLAHAIAARVKPVAHDALVVTGDYRNSTDKDYGPSMKLMELILQDLDSPRYGILGNHDFIEMVWHLEAHGLPVLLNESVSLARGSDRLWIAGVDDPHFYKTHDIAKALSSIPEDACVILLCHSPEAHEEAAQYPIDLMLSGHTHGGQLCMPGGRHIICPVGKLPRSHVKGRWQSGTLQGYTSPGTGTCGVAGRLNCPPEITLHHLHCT
jgi:predicted MPP superfamily phosphohydrolase